MAQPNDPWNQNFPAFKTAYQTATPPKSNFSVFTKNDIQALMNLPNLSHIVVYSTQFPATSNPAERKMVAIAVDSAGNRISNPGLQYVVATHNCPPDCDNLPLLNAVNIMFGGPA